MTRAARKLGFSIPPHALFTVRPSDIVKAREQGMSRFAAEKAVVRGRIKSLVLRDDPPTNLQQIVLYAMEQGYL